jgi:hypothetical protein
MAVDRVQGVGESKLHGGDTPGLTPERNWTIDGKKVPAYLNVPYDVTDQGRAERKAKIEASGGIIADHHLEMTDANDKRAGAVGNPDGAGFAKGALDPRDLTYQEPDNALGKYREGLENGVDPLDNPNGMEAAMRKHLPAGMRGRFLSPRKCAIDGTRGWEPILVDDGKGTMVQVRVGDMILAAMPENRAKRREERTVQMHAEQISNTAEEARERIAQAGVDAAALRRVAKKRGQELDGLYGRQNDQAGEMPSSRERGAGAEDLDAPNSPRLPGAFEVTI